MKIREFEEDAKKYYDLAIDALRYGNTGIALSNAIRSQKFHELLGGAPTEVSSLVYHLREGKSCYFSAREYSRRGDVLNTINQINRSMHHYNQIGVGVPPIVEFLFTDLAGCFDILMERDADIADGRGDGAYKPFIMIRKGDHVTVGGNSVVLDDANFE